MIFHCPNQTNEKRKETRNRKDVNHTETKSEEERRTDSTSQSRTNSSGDEICK